MTIGLEGFILTLRYPVSPEVSCELCLHDVGDIDGGRRRSREQGDDLTLTVGRRKC